MESELNHAPEVQQNEVEPVSRGARAWHWFERLSPWVSLVVSVLSAAYMDRSESAGGTIVLCAALGFVALLVVLLSHRDAHDAQDTPGKWQKVVQLTSVMGSQSMLQSSLFFSAPFYVQASAFTPLQCLFLTVLLIAVVVSLWDPWSARVMLHPLLGPLLLSFAGFVAWNAALPMLGVGHQRALWWSAGAVSVLVPMLQLFHHSGLRRRSEVILGGAVVPLLLALFGVAALPAAPLKVVDAGIGTDVQERALVGRAQALRSAPEKLCCFSAVFAPRGMSDQLLHVWTRDGEPLHDITLTVRGGRKAGFRTWSKLPIPAGARGTYRCEVRTPLGQVLSVSEVMVGARSTKL